jgi:hypothetical protein
VSSPLPDSLPAVPRLRLLVPPLLPVAIVAVVYLAELAGHTWNVHGDFILVFLILLGTCAVALVLEIAALVKSVRLIRTGAARPSALDVLCIAFGGAFAAGAGGLLAVFLSRY